MRLVIALQVPAVAMESRRSGSIATVYSLLDCARSVSGLIIGTGTESVVIERTSAHAAWGRCPQAPQGLHVAR